MSLLTPIRAVALAAATLFAVACGPAHALPSEPYSAERLAALQAEGKTVLVDVHAPWCPTCRRQGEILTTALAEPQFKHVAALTLDWDDQRDEARAHGAPRQSTLLLFKGGTKLGMQVAETDPAKIRAFLAQKAE
jgi:thiol:disulfide interchange protein